MKIEYKNRLPHIAPLGATFFVTFRLGDSLPHKVITELKVEMNDIIEKIKKENPRKNREQIRNQRKLLFKNMIISWTTFHLVNAI